MREQQHIHEGWQRQGIMEYPGLPKQACTMQNSAVQRTLCLKHAWTSVWCGLALPETPAKVLEAVDQVQWVLVSCWTRFSPRVRWNPHSMVSWYASVSSIFWWSFCSFSVVFYCGFILTVMDSQKYTHKVNIPGYDIFTVVTQKCSVIFQLG